MGLLQQIENKPQPDLSLYARHCIMIETAFHCGITLEQLKLRTRDMNIALPRMIAMYLMLEKLPECGPTCASAQFSLKHTAAIHARKTIKNLLQYDDGIQTLVRNITLSLENNQLFQVCS